WRVRKWIHARAWKTNFPHPDVWKQFSDASEPLSAEQTFNSALKQFEQLSSASRARFFGPPPIYELSPEQLCGQIASSAEVAVGIGLSWLGLPLLIRASDPALRIFCGVAAGMLAPVARDMMAAVQGLRRA